MEFYSIPDIPHSRFRDMIFKTSAAPKWGAFILTSLACAGLIGSGNRGGYNSAEVHLPPLLLYWVGGVMGLVALFILVYARAALRPSNWLLKFNTERTLVKFRSHLNDHFPEEDPAVLFLFNSEIEWIRKVRETLSSPQTDSAGTAERLSFWTYLEVKLADSVDVSKLKEALQAERKRQAPKIGRTRTKHKHYPVKLTDAGILRLEWNGIRPGIDKTLNILGKRFGQQSEQHVRTKHWNDLEGEQLDDRILDLAEKGNIVEAIALAKLKYGYDLTEAKKFVEELT